VSALRRALAAALVAAVALPAAAYLLPIPAILRRVAERRAAQGLATLEVTGTVQASGASADALLEAGGIRAAGGVAALPARLTLKIPGRCRLELLPVGASEAERPWLLVRDDAVSGSDRLASDPAFVALARATCTLLARPLDPEAKDKPWAAALAKRGVPLSNESLGRFDGRVAWVIGGRATDTTPLAWFDKDSFQPVRLQFTEGRLAADVRLLGWGSPTGGDWAPRAIELHTGGALQIRFTTEKATANPRLPDAIF
jgi:hypothetical protein